MRPGVAWSQCPVLTANDLGTYSYSLLGETFAGDNSPLVEPLFLGRRGFWTEKTTKYPEGCEALWKRLTEGAYISWKKIIFFLLAAIFCFT